MAVSLATIARSHIRFTPDDGLYPMSLSLLIEFNGSEHIAMIGHGNRRHTKRLNLFEERVQLIGAVKETILRMEMEMNELRGHSMYPSLKNSPRGIVESQRALRVYYSTIIK